MKNWVFIFLLLSQFSCKAINWTNYPVSNSIPPNATLLVGGLSSPAGPTNAQIAQSNFIAVSAIHLLSNDSTTNLSVNHLSVTNVYQYFPQAWFDKGLSSNAINCLIGPNILTNNNNIGFSFMSPLPTNVVDDQPEGDGWQRYYNFGTYAYEHAYRYWGEYWLQAVSGINIMHENGFGNITFGGGQAGMSPIITWADGSISFISLTNYFDNVGNAWFGGNVSATSFSVGQIDITRVRVEGYSQIHSITPPNVFLRNVEGLYVMQFSNASPYYIVYTNSVSGGPGTNCVVWYIDQDPNSFFPNTIDFEPTNRINQNYNDEFNFLDGTSQGNAPYAGVNVDGAEPAINDINRILPFYDTLRIFPCYKTTGVGFTNNAVSAYATILQTNLGTSYASFTNGCPIGTHVLWPSNGVNGALYDILVNGNSTTLTVLSPPNLSGSGITNIAGVSGILQSNIIGAITGTNCVHYTVPSGVTNTYSVFGYLNVTALTLDVIQPRVVFTDERGTVQTLSLGTSISATGFNSLPYTTIRVKGGTVIDITNALTTGTGSIAYDVGAQLNANSSNQ